MPRLKWTRDRILLEIRRLHARGEKLSARRLQAIGFGGMVATAYKLFGSWREAIEAAGVQAPVVRARKWSLERIIAQIRYMAAEGEDLSFSNARRSNPRLVQGVYRHPELGNWGRALTAAGLEPETHRQRLRWTRQEIINQVQRIAAEDGSLAFGDARREHPRLVSAACSEHHFGSWGKAVAAAGLDYEEYRQRRRWTRERILATIKHLHASGQPLTSTRLQRDGYGALVAAARKKSMFGSWRDAIECAGVDYEQMRRNAQQAGKQQGEDE